MKCLTGAMLVALSMGIGASTAAFAFPLSWSASVTVQPWVPTPSQKVIVQFSDSLTGALNATAIIRNVDVVRNDKTITISAQIEPSLSGSMILERTVDLGTLPPGRYTVIYRSDGQGNPSYHTASQSFTVSETGPSTAVEYFNAGLGHYFVTADRGEIDKLDSGVIHGWVRTGESFKVMFGEEAATNAFTVCRFYGLPSAGIDSHFFAASAAECAQVIAKWPSQWILETTDAFAVANDANNGGGCQSGSKSLYRVYNNRPDANHRYTTSTQTRDSMIAQGWIPEGAAASPASRDFVAMCVPE